jgi:UDP-glucose 4-epimerase
MQIENGRFLITGGFGLIASHIADHLLGSGAAEVVLLDNAAIGTDAGIAHLVGNPRVRVVRGDVLRLEEMMAALTGIDGVFHTAAFITMPLSQRLWTGIDVNVRGLMTVLEACRWQKVKRLIYSSSIAAFGNATSGTVTEQTPYVGAGVQPASALYGIGKLMGEQLCAFYHEQHGLETMALRYSTVYGERQHARGVNVLPMVEAYDRIAQGLPPIIPGDGTEVHDYVYAGDVARANLLAMQAAAAHETLIIASGVPTSFNELVATVLLVCGSD